MENQAISDWVNQYFSGYHKYMEKYHNDLYQRFYYVIFPLQKINGGIHIGMSKQHTREDYNRIQLITTEFCCRYKEPGRFPEEF
jgi:hypothetical protein